MYPSCVPCLITAHSDMGSNDWIAELGECYFTTETRRAQRPEARGSPDPGSEPFFLRNLGALCASVVNSADHHAWLSWAWKLECPNHGSHCPFSCASFRSNAFARDREGDRAAL